MQNNAFSQQIADLRAAIEKRDADEAAERGITVFALQTEREAAHRVDVSREIREMRIERLGADRRLITPADFARIISTEPGALDSTKA